MCRGGRFSLRRLRPLGRLRQRPCAGRRRPSRPSPARSGSARPGSAPRPATLYCASSEFLSFSAALYAISLAVGDQRRPRPCRPRPAGSASVTSLDRPRGLGPLRPRRSFSAAATLTCLFASCACALFRLVIALPWMPNTFRCTWMPVATSAGEAPRSTIDSPTRLFCCWYADRTARPASACFAAISFWPASTSAIAVRNARSAAGACPRQPRRRPSRRRACPARRRTGPGRPCTASPPGCTRQRTCDAGRRTRPGRPWTGRSARRAVSSSALDRVGPPGQTGPPPGLRRTGTGQRSKRRPPSADAARSALPRTARSVRRWRRCCRLA